MFMDGFGLDGGVSYRQLWQSPRVTCGTPAHVAGSLDGALRQADFCWGRGTKHRN